MKNTLSKEQFSEAVKGMVSAQMGKDYRVILHKIAKNNGIVKEGIIITEKHKEASPMIYLDNVYEQYQDGYTLDAVDSEVISIYKRHQEDVSFNKNEYLHFDFIKEKIVMKLINYELNKELLMEVPYESVLDLAVVAYVLLDGNTEGIPCILINNTHLEFWNVSKNEIFLYAKENSRRLLPERIMNMEMYLSKIMGTENFDESDQNQLKIYVLTNRHSLNGSVCCLYDGILKQLALEHGTDIIILPSSIHEVLLIPDNGTVDVSSLLTMVTEINNEVVNAEEVLSNSVYVYKKELDRIRIMK